MSEQEEIIIKEFVDNLSKAITEYFIGSGFRIMKVIKDIKQMNKVKVKWTLKS